MPDLNVEGKLAVSQDAGVSGNLQIGGNGFIFGGLTVDDTSLGAGKLRLPGDITLGVENPESTVNTLDVRTPNGWVRIGPRNTSWSHFYTDRSKYYFNRPVYVDSGMVGSYLNDHLRLHTGGSTKVTIRHDNGRVGVGLTDPRTELHVLGRIASGQDFSSGGALTLYPPDGFAWFHIDNGPAGGRAIGRLRISHGATPGRHELMTLQQDGKVGVGTDAPRVAFEVNGNRIRISDPRNANRYLDLRVDGNELDLSGHNQNALYINANGRETRVFNARHQSSSSLKQDIEPLAVSEATKMLTSIEPVRFRYRNDPEELHYGLIAEDTPPPLSSPDGRSIDYAGLTAMLSGIVADQQRQLTELKTELQNLRRQLSNRTPARDRDW